MVASSGARQMTALGLVVVVALAGCRAHSAPAQTQVSPAAPPRPTTPASVAAEAASAPKNLPAPDGQVGPIRAELRPSKPWSVAAIREGKLSLGHFDRSVGILVAGQDLHLLERAGPKATGIRLPDGITEGAKALAGSWSARRLWADHPQEGPYRMRKAAPGAKNAWDLEAQEGRRWNPVLFRGAWMGIDQVDTPQRVGEGWSQDIRQTFTPLRGEPTVLRPPIERGYLVADYELHGDDLWAVVMPPSGQRPFKLVRWARTGSRWTEIALPKRAGVAARPEFILDSTGKRLFVDVAVPRIQGVDPKGVEMTAWICGVPYDGPNPMTIPDTTRDAVAMFEGNVWSLIIPPGDGSFDAVAEDPSGGLYAIVNGVDGLLTGPTLYHRKAGAAPADWRPIPLPELALVGTNVEPGASRTAFEPYDPMDVIVRDGEVWLVARAKGFSTMGPISRIRRTWALLRLAPASDKDLVVLPGDPPPPAVPGFGT